jgi:hypothetical protein
MRKLTIIFALLFSLTCNAQEISFDGIISINWNDHPFSIVEMLTEKGFKYMGKLSIDDPLDPSEQTRETLYNLIYGYKNVKNPNVVVNVVVDEMCKNNISSYWPVVKLRFKHESKYIFNKLSEEIKSACGEPDLGFYIASNSLTFAIDKELLSGEPTYVILIYRMSKEKLEENKNAVKKIIEQLQNE